MILTALSLGFAVLFSPQSPVLDSNETTIQAALQQLSSQQTLFLQLQGSILYHGNSVPLITNLSWNSFLGGATGTYLTDQVEMETWVNGVLTKRLVGNGTTLWSYDLKNRVYSATNYGGSGTTRPGTYVTDLLNDLNWAATSNDAYLTRLLRQIYNPVSTTSNVDDPSYNPSGITYASWMPGVPSVQLPATNPTTDPINNQVVYSPSAADNFFLYNGSPRRSITFEVLNGTPAVGTTVIPETLETVYFNQLDTVNHFQRLTSWQIKPYTGFTFATTLFQPYTPIQIQGWHTVVPPRATTN